MSAQQPNLELMQILSFDANELELNRSGRLSLQQRILMLREMDYLFALFVVLLPVWLIGWAIGQFPFVQVLMVVAMIAVTGILNRTSVKILVDILAGQVQNVSGSITIRIYIHKRTTFLGIMGVQYANGTIGDVTFHLPVAMADNFQGKSLQIFYTPRYRKAVSGEITVEK
jgi:hypothetical protein